MYLFFAMRNCVSAGNGEADHASAEQVSLTLQEQDDSVMTHKEKNLYLYEVCKGLHILHLFEVTLNEVICYSGGHEANAQSGHLPRLCTALPPRPAQ